MGGKTSLTPKFAHIAASESSNDIMQSENGLSASATSYDDVQDSVPTDEYAEEELGSQDDDPDVAPAPRKGKGTMRSRPRIESDDEPEGGDEEGYVEALPVVKLPPSHRIRNAVDPSFSISPSSSKRIATPPKTVRGTRRLFSPARPTSALIKPFSPPAPSLEMDSHTPKSASANPQKARGKSRIVWILNASSLNSANTVWKWGERAPSTTDISDEEQWEAKPPRANVAVVSQAVPNPSPQKDAQKDGERFKFSRLGGTLTNAHLEQIPSHNRKPSLLSSNCGLPLPLLLRQRHLSPATNC
jgi:hypothetical protein